MLEMSPDDIDIRDIAHHLARLCRYNGAVRGFLSVAEHCIAVSKYIQTELRKQPGYGNLPTWEFFDYQRWGLLHDAAEAYMGDVPAGLKRRPEWAFYKPLELKLLQKVSDKFKLSWPEPSVIKQLDNRIVRNEQEQNLAAVISCTGEELSPRLQGVVVGVMTPEQAETAFLARYHELWA